jgi:hypothetical protein
MSIKKRVLMATLFVLSGSAQAAGMAPGLYECWAWGSARMLLNVTVTGPTTYRGESTGEDGTYALEGTSLSWLSGPLQGIMPDGFTSTYEVREGTPTISYGKPGNTEATVCENAP